MSKYNVSVKEGEGFTNIRVEKIDPKIHFHHSGRPFTKEELASFDTVKEAK
jgi:hypothetical protein